MVEVPSYTTIFRCLQPGRSRIDAELVVDVATVLLGDGGQASSWRQAHQLIVGEACDASLVQVHTSLPQDIDRLAGRETEVRRVLEVTCGERSPGTIGIWAIEGMAGVGKTTLAVHTAHEMSKRIDVELQFAVNLRGFDPDHSPADPAAVLASFLQHLGVPGHQIHALDLAARACRYRELMAAKRAILLLDNAAGEDQVRPLLPGSPTCRVLITSRRSLARLRDARHLPLDVLATDEALDLLRNAVGAARINAEPDVAGKIAEITDHLPLALALVSGRINATPDWTLADHYERLAEHRDLLRLEGGVDLAFALSYDELDGMTRRVLRLLALHPGRDFDAYAAAALANADLDTATRQLGILADANLLTEREKGRYELHDLVRVFATQQARDEEAPRVRRNALAHLTDYYRRAISIAMDAYELKGQQQRPAIGEPETPTPVIADRAAASAWLDTERANLIAVIRAARSAQPDLAGEIALAVNGYLAARDDRTDRLDVLLLGKESASSTGRHHLACRLGLAEFGARRQAGGRSRELLALAEETLAQIVEHRLAELEAPARYQVAVAAYDSCEFEHARDLASAALEVCAADGNQRQSRAGPLCLLGKIKWDGEPRDPDGSIALLRRAVDAQPPGTRQRAIILSSLADVLTGLGMEAEAEVAVREAREIVESIGDTLGRASIDVEDARVAVLQRNWHRAHDLIRSARTVFNDQPDSEAEVSLAIAEAELAIAQDRIDEARASLTAAAQRAKSSGNPIDAWKIRRLLEAEVIRERLPHQ